MTIFRNASRAEEACFYTPREDSSSQIQVEVFGTNANHLNPFEWMTLHYNRSIPISDNVILVIDQKSQAIYRVVTVNKRRVAYLLSGSKKYRDFFLDAGSGTLYAIAQDGSLDRFSWAKWKNTGPWKFFGSRVIRFAGSFCLSAMGLAIYMAADPSSEMISRWTQYEELLVLTGGGLLLSGTIWALATYSERNRSPNGFVPTGVRLEGYRHLTPTGCQSLLAGYGDVVISMRTGEHSFRQIKHDHIFNSSDVTIRDSFDVNTDDERLPRPR